jgi:hypothetical protein
LEGRPGVSAEPQTFVGSTWDFSRREASLREVKTNLDEQIASKRHSHSHLTQSFFHVLGLYPARMAAIGSLVFCTDCGNLLETNTSRKTYLTCEVCGAQNKGEHRIFT